MVRLIMNILATVVGIVVIGFYSKAIDDTLSIFGTYSACNSLFGVTNSCKSVTKIYFINFLLMIEQVMMIQTGENRRSLDFASAFPHWWLPECYAEWCFDLPYRAR